MSGLQYHLRLKPGDVPRYVLLPGDPERVERIAETWDEWRLVARHREYVTYVGKYRGAPIAATSTGIGSASTAIAVEELLRVGADTFIRVGSTGSLWRDIAVGDLVISTAAVRLEGASKHYAEPEYPAAAHYEVVLSLIEAAERLGYRYHVGITASTDSFYVGQERPGYGGFLPRRGLIDHLKELRVLNFEMEAATIFTLSNIYGARAGAVCAVYANRETGEFVEGRGEKEAIMTANNAVYLLWRWDKLKATRRKKHLYPGLIGAPQ